MAALAGVAPLPESEQAVMATRILDAYHGSHPANPPKVLYVVYFTPADREPAAQYAQRLETILEDIRAFYRDGMERLGFGPKTFSLAHDTQGKLIIHLVKGKEPEADFPRWIGRNGGNTGDPAGGEMVKRDCWPVLEASGISPDHETLLIFCHLATYDEKAGTFRHHSPYFGSWSQQAGLCFAADWAQQSLDNLTRTEPRLNDGEYGDMSLGKHTTIFLGGIAHELGHAFALPHCGERWDEKELGTSLMGAGNHTYREEKRGEGKGSFLTMASAMRLASRPLFNRSDKDSEQPGKLQQCTLLLTTNVTRSELTGRRGTLRLEGTVTGTPTIYGVIAYFDAVHDGGYRSSTATSVPDAPGRFAVEVSDLAPCASGDLRVEFCHVNGAVSEKHLEFTVSGDGCVDLTQWEARETLRPVAEAVERKDRDAAQAALRQIENSSAPDLAKNVAHKLAATLSDGPRLTPAAIPSATTNLALGDAQAENAEVGWLEPAANRIPTNDQIDSPVLDSGNIYATGLYAHAPSRYVFALGGKWKQLTGKAGLHTLHQPYGSVRFIVKTDGHEAFRSAIIRGAKQASYKVDLTGVKSLELIVDPTTDGKHNDWGLWLDPVVTR
jgi:hypothetical protein